MNRTFLISAGMVCTVVVCLSQAGVVTAQEKLRPAKLFAQDNLVAWCIVPFDAKKRGPEERAAMLKRLGFAKFAYDYRAEHIPTFDAEVEALQKQGIELTAWWFPQTLNAEARQILDVLKRHKLKTQLWVTGSGAATKSADEQAARIKAEADRIRPIAEEAAKIGCTVALYNHGGWFGEPENQLAVINELKLPNVGLVYNLHHGHDHLDRFPALLKQMLPHLWCLNLNGMVKNGEAEGRKILPLGQGDLDLPLLKTIVESGYHGPMGILGHTQDDAQQRLQDNLDGLRWLVAQRNGQPSVAKPTPRTPVPPAPKTSSTHDAHPAPVVAAAVDAPLPAAYDASLVTTLVAAAKERGDAHRGIRVFGSAKFACLSCHQVGTQGGPVGPALSDVGKRLKPEEIAEALLWPKHQVKPEYVAWRLLLSDGRSVQGYKRGETANSIELFDPAAQRTLSVAKNEIEEQREMGTLMPDGLAAAMTSAQRRDVLRLLLELGNKAGLEREVKPESSPAEFVFNRAPLDRNAWRLWQEPVNRDRVYDFYLKEALFFRTPSSRPHLLPAFPGIDGGKLGHWGNQNEEVWKDDRWNQTDLGTLLAGVFHGPGGQVVPKSVCVRLGDRGELAACFNPETLTYDAVWRDGFIRFSEIRHGFLDGLRPAGQTLPRPEGKKPTQPFVYRGYYRLGPKVVFAYRLGDVEMLDSAWVKAGQFERIVAPRSEHRLRAALGGGVAQWPQEIKTGGELGPDRPYTVDTIRPPFENPWKALLFLSDHDFLPDSSALVATMTGDVWRVTGLEGKLDNVRWRRFASGLNQPLGLLVAEGSIFVMGRDQITRLHDLNGDGEADFYECVFNQMVTSPAGHDFTCGLVRDKQGRFLAVSGKQGLIRISPDNGPVEVVATGFRNADGLSLLDDGRITVPCSEGDWTPASMICLVQPDQKPPPHFGYQGPQGGQPPSLPLVYLPRGLDNSSGGQTTVNDSRFGPLAGQLLHFSFGQGSQFLVLRDEVGGQPQGAVVPLAGEFRSGVHRGKVNPRDGQLYVSGMAGWGSYTPDDGCFHRVRYTGQRVQLPKSLHVHENGILVSFVEPVERATATNPANQFAQAWNYRYSSGYGSPELAPSHPGVVGHELLEVAGVHWIDERTLFVEMPELQPVNQLHLVLQVDQGRPQELFLTVHRLDQPFTRFPAYQPRQKLIAAHPQSVDLALLGKTLPNPWGKRGRPTVTATLDIEAGKNLTFSTRLLRVKAGERVQLTFTNPDVVPHNWVLVKPERLSSVGDLANKLVADPEAVLHQYVPKSDDVLVYTDIVPPQQSFTIWFDAPRAKGRYPYLCTFPGHWMVMNGEMVVE